MARYNVHTVYVPKPQELVCLSSDVVTVGFLFHTEAIVMFKNKKFENPMSVLFICFHYIFCSQYKVRKRA